MAQSIDALKGRKNTSKWFTNSDITQFTGSLKSIKDETLRRMMLQMLLKGVIEEQYVQQQNTITVYLVAGKFANAFSTNKIDVTITQG